MKFNFGSFLSKALLAILPAFLTKGKVSTSDVVTGVVGAAGDELAQGNQPKQGQ